MTTGRTLLPRRGIALAGFLGLALALIVPVPPAGGAEPDAGFERLYGELLATYWRPPVTIHGIRTTTFDYAGMKRDAEADDSIFRRTLAALEHAEPDRLAGEAALKAFWLNAYNFAAIRLIVDHYPVDSIRSLKISLLRHPWSKAAIRIGGTAYALEEIEKGVLLKRAQDPRIVFAVNCAAVSCPDRIPEPFTAERLDAQMDGMIRTFLSNPGKGLALHRDTRILTVSWIFKKDAHLFPGDRGGVLGFIRPYLPPETRARLEANPVAIRYFDHDWTLNDVAQARGEDG